MSHLLPKPKKRNRNRSRDEPLGDYPRDIDTNAGWDLRYDARRSRWQLLKNWVKSARLPTPRFAKAVVHGVVVSERGRPGRTVW
jgi:hypothetical protein